MSKTPARKAPPQKPAASKPVPAKKAAAKPAPAAKPAGKKTAAAKAKPAPAAKSAAPKTAPAPKKPVKPATVAKPAAAAKPVPPPMKSAPPPAPVPAAPALPPGSPAPVVLRKPGRGASKYAAPAVQAPLPPPTSRFADRFAPPRPPTRQMNNLELDTPRHAQKADPKLANAWKTKSGRELTEPEVLAMPEAEYMNDKQLEFFRFKLQTLKDDLLSNAGETTEHLREDTSIVPDPADRATIEEEHALELRTRDRERKLLKKISQSLARLDSGEYGFCDETGEPIGLGRLIARPTATLSLEAQQRRELKQKMFGD
ncbi:MAG: RNA polymerase-binding protein DksA [Burkholderiaceae bacterium]